MLGKLIKHEWKSMWKIPTILIAALLVIAVLAGLPFISPVWRSGVGGLELFSVLVWLLFYFAIIGVSMGIMLYLAVRFYRSMFTDEGYLTHTLPVTVHQLLISKSIVMMIWIFLSMVGICISILIFGSMAIFFLNFELSLRDLWTGLLWEIKMGTFSGMGPSFVNFALSIIFMLIASTVNGAMMITGSISLGQMVSRHKVLGSIGAYFAINTVVQIASMVVMMPMMLRLGFEQTNNVFQILTSVYWGMGVLSILVSVGLYFLSEYLIRRHLNLD